jgi:polysaccharide biosynthesis/export protein
MNMRRVVVEFLAVITVLGAASARAADYTIGKEDVLGISVWLHSELERTVTVNADGKVVFPPLGELQAEGTTAKALGDRIAERLGSYLRQPTQVTVTVTQYNSRAVFVNGAVAHPGKYGFESIPGLVEVIGTAGGATPNADLTQVQIIRKEGDARRTITADVAASMRSETPTGLPPLRPGDTVMVPATVTSASGAGAVGGEVVAVFGEVQKPGIYPVGQGQDILSVLALAGGGTERGDMSKVHVIERTGTAQTVFTVNVKRTTQLGTTQPFMVKPGDVVVLEPSQSSSWAKGWTGFGAALTVGLNIVNVALLIQLLNQGGTTSK